MTETHTADAVPAELSLVLIQLFKGPLYRDSHERLWPGLLRLRSQIADYVAVLGLQAVIDEAEGYSYLATRPAIDDGAELPRLVARRTLSFQVSVLLALLRKRLAEFDASSADARLVLSRDQVVEMVRVFLPEASNEARLVDGIETTLNKVIDLGFLRRLRNEPDRFEVRRILKAYVDGQWLADFDARLAEYLTELTATEEAG
jgi:hypothetical protein